MSVLPGKRSLSGQVELLRFLTLPHDCETISVLPDSQSGPRSAEAFSGLCFRWHAKMSQCNPVLSDGCLGGGGVSAA